MIHQRKNDIFCLQMVKFICKKMHSAYKTFILCSLLCVTLASRVAELPGFGTVHEEWFSGYKRVSSQNGKNGTMFYWFFEGPKDAPVMVKQPFEI
jgi:hypothetical protein